MKDKLTNESLLGYVKAWYEKAKYFYENISTPETWRPENEIALQQIEELIDGDGEHEAGLGL